MRIAFVGVKRKYQDLACEYREMFNQYHLELPFYYARDGGNDVTITTVDYEPNFGELLEHRFGVHGNIRQGSLTCILEKNFQKRDYDVVIHWRKWFPEFYVPGALNLINCQDHSFSLQWKDDVRTALSNGQLYGILCFPTWHKRDISVEVGIPEERLLDGVTLGVDTDIYTPAVLKDPYSLLWASDPGRGFIHALQLVMYLWKKDKRFRLHVCYPDYVQGNFLPNHPAIVNHGSMKNGTELWALFNSCGVLPYTSTFKEPSSRAHRQAQAAGSLVVYPKDMGTPSELITHGETGLIASHPNDVLAWSDLILSSIETGDWQRIGMKAREMAVSENWQVQAQRFNSLVKGIRG